MKQLHMFDDSIMDYEGLTYTDFMAERAGKKTNGLKKKISRILKISEESNTIKSLEYLGFFSDEKLPYYETTPFEITADRMIRRMSLSPDDRDMVILQHVLLAEWPDGRKEVIKSSMLDFGTPSTNTAISRTVALPAAIGVKLILENKISLAGVYRPVLPEIYNPVTDELKTLGIEMKEEFGLPESDMIVH